MGMGQPDDDNGGRLPNEHAVELVAAMTDASKLARDHLGRARERQKKDYDARISVNKWVISFIMWILHERKDCPLNLIPTNSLAHVLLSEFITTSSLKFGQVLNVRAEHCIMIDLNLT